MRIVILNGADLESPAVDDMCAQVERQLAVQKATVRVFHLRELSIGHCLGEFDCWVKTPGRCRIHDEGQEIERAMHDAELLVLLTPVRYAGYGPKLKKAVDRLIPLVAPFFEQRADVTHHQHRYERLPRFVGIRWSAHRSEPRDRLLCNFVESNALNLGCPSWGDAVLGDDRNAWPESIARAIASSAVPGNASGSAPGAAQFLREMMTAQPSPQFVAHPKVAILVARARLRNEHVRIPGTLLSSTFAGARSAGAGRPGNGFRARSHDCGASSATTGECRRPGCGRAPVCRQPAVPGDARFGASALGPGE